MIDYNLFNKIDELDKRLNLIEYGPLEMQPDTKKLRDSMPENLLNFPLWMLGVQIHSEEISKLHEEIKRLEKIIERFAEVLLKENKQ